MIMKATSLLIPGCYGSPGCFRSRKEKSMAMPEPEERPEYSEDAAVIPLEVLQRATYNFSRHKIIGRGGEAAVFRGMIGGRDVAIKKFKHPKQLKMIDNDKLFVPEMSVLRQCEHENIIRFIGFSFEKDPDLNKNAYTTFCVVTEFIGSGSLHAWLHSNNNDQSLTWKERVDIIVGICKGLEHVHSKRIVHLDLKPSNILLDQGKTPKICDFGVSQFLSTHGSYQSTTPIVSFGYTDPEYINTGLAEPATDVYSFGVIIFEIISGKENQKEGLVQRAREIFNKDQIEIGRRPDESAIWQLQDPKLETSATPGFKTLAKIAQMCIDTDIGKRPDASAILQEFLNVRRLIDLID